MAVPLIHPPPPVVTQTAQTCWACACESWLEANERFTGLDNTIGRHDLIRWLGSGEGLVYEDERRRGRATPEGMTVMAGIGLMQLTPYRARRVSVDRLGRELEKGYLYLTYFSRPGRAAHAVVCYGVDGSNIYVMDPMPGAGLGTREASYFLQMPSGRVVIGTPMMIDLVRSGRANVERLGL
jgi:hypothetical protein